MEISAKEFLELDKIKTSLEVSLMHCELVYESLQQSKEEDVNSLAFAPYYSTIQTLYNSAEATVIALGQIISTLEDQ